MRTPEMTERFHQIVFVGSLLTLSWFAMMAMHEAGHVVGALLTGGTVKQVILYPLSISRTDVQPNPHPSIVVWMGPLLGSLIPAIVWWLVPRRLPVARSLSTFFLGFCLVANGAYIAFGASDRVGDCGVMLRSGSPAWTLYLFGAITIPMGFAIWHRLGSIRQFLAHPSMIPTTVIYTLVGVLVALVALELMISPR